MAAMELSGKRSSGYHVLTANGSPVSLRNLKRCTVIVDGFATTVQIAGCKQCRILIVSAASSVTFTRCDSIIASISAAQVVLTAVHSAVLCLDVSASTIVGAACRDIAIAPWNVQPWPAVQGQRRDPHGRAWKLVHCASPSTTSDGPPYTLLDASDPSCWYDGEGADGTPHVSPMARLAVAALLDFFDAASLDGGWDGQEMNAYSAAVGDESILVRDDIHLAAMLSSHAVPLIEVPAPLPPRQQGEEEQEEEQQHMLVPRPRLGLNGLLALYGKQGVLSLIRDIQHAGLEGLCGPGTLPPWRLHVQAVKDAQGGKGPGKAAFPPAWRSAFNMSEQGSGAGATVLPVRGLRDKPSMDPAFRTSPDNPLLYQEEEDTQQVVAAASSSDMSGIDYSVIHSEQQQQQQQQQQQATVPVTPQPLAPVPPLTPAPVSMPASAPAPAPVVVPPPSTASSAAQAAPVLSAPVPLAVPPVSTSGVAQAAGQQQEREQTQAAMLHTTAIDKELYFVSDEGDGDAPPSLPTLRELAQQQASGITAVQAEEKGKALTEGDLQGLLAIVRSELKAVCTSKPPHAYMYVREQLRQFAVSADRALPSIRTGKVTAAAILTAPQLRALLADIGLEWPLPVVSILGMTLGGYLQPAVSEGDASLEKAAARARTAVEPQLDQVCLPVLQLEAALSSLRHGAGKAQQQPASASQVRQAVSSSAGSGPSPVPRSPPGKTRWTAISSPASPSTQVRPAAMDAIVAILSDCTAVFSERVSPYLSESHLLPALRLTAVLHDTWAACEAQAAAEAWVGTSKGEEAVQAEEVRLAEGLIHAGVPLQEVVPGVGGGVVPTALALAGKVHPAIREQAVHGVIKARAEAYRAALLDAPEGEAQIVGQYVRDTMRARVWPVPVEDMGLPQDIREQLPSTEGAEAYPRGFEAWLRWRHACRLAKKRGIRPTWSGPALPRARTATAASSSTLHPRSSHTEKQAGTRHVPDAVLVTKQGTGVLPGAAQAERGRPRARPSSMWHADPSRSFVDLETGTLTRMPPPVQPALGEPPFEPVQAARRQVVARLRSPSSRGEAMRSRLARVVSALSGGRLLPHHDAADVPDDLLAEALHTLIAQEAEALLAESHAAVQRMLPEPVLASPAGSERAGGRYSQGEREEEEEVDIHRAHMEALQVQEQYWSNRERSMRASYAQRSSAGVASALLQGQAQEEGEQQEQQWRDHEVDYGREPAQPIEYEQYPPEDAGEEHLSKLGALVARAESAVQLLEARAAAVAGGPVKASSSHSRKGSHSGSAMQSVASSLGHSSPASSSGSTSGGAVLGRHVAERLGSLPFVASSMVNAAMEHGLRAQHRSHDGPRGGRGAPSSGMQPDRPAGASSGGGRRGDYVHLSVHLHQEGEEEEEEEGEGEGVSYMQDDAPALAEAVCQTDEAGEQEAWQKEGEDEGEDVLRDAGVASGRQAAEAEHERRTQGARSVRSGSVASSRVSVSHLQSAATPAAAVGEHAATAGGGVRDERFEGGHRPPRFSSKQSAELLHRVRSRSPAAKELAQPGADSRAWMPVGTIHRRKLSAANVMDPARYGASKFEHPNNIYGPPGPKPRTMTSYASRLGVSSVLGASIRGGKHDGGGPVVLGDSALRVGTVDDSWTLAVVDESKLFLRPRAEAVQAPQLAHASLGPSPLLAAQAEDTLRWWMQAKHNAS